MTILFGYYISNEFNGMKEYLVEKLFAQNDSKYDNVVSHCKTNNVYVKIWSKSI